MVIYKVCYKWYDGDKKKAECSRFKTIEKAKKYKLYLDSIPKEPIKQERLYQKTIKITKIKWMK